MPSAEDGPGRFRDDDDAIQLALFRYGVIGPLVEREDFAPGEVVELVREIAERTHYRPGTGPVRVRERTVYDWRRRYRTGGIEALRPRVRKDRGRRRVLCDEVLERAIQLRKERPKRWTSTLLDIMKREGTFDRQARPSPGHPRPPPRRAAECRPPTSASTLGEKRTIKMHFEHFGDLWVGDYKHGPVVLAPDGKLTTAKLSAFLDHATRYPVAHRFYLAENLASLRDTLMRAFLTWGPAKRTYVDRGSAYRAEQLAYSLARIHSHLIHSRPYYSQGRGLIEKWWQHADAFLVELEARDEPLNLHELNRLWAAWCELR